MKKHHGGAEVVMEKPTLLRNVMVKALVFCVFVICFRFAYVITIRGESCDVGDFCFFSLPDSLTFSTTTTTTATTTAISTTSSAADEEIRYYASIFQDLISEGFLSPKSTSLIIDTSHGHEVSALKSLSVSSAIGAAKKSSKPLIVGYKNTSTLPFSDNSFDFIFIPATSSNLEKLADEISRTLKPEAYLVAHTSSNDTYSLHSFISLFSSCCTFIRSHILHGSDVTTRQLILKKEFNHNHNNNFNFNNIHNVRECNVVPGYKAEIIRNAEELIKVEPMKPWITLKRNIQNIKYLSEMVDISYKRRYVYVDVGARSYGSSIGSWFKKQYPKQNKTFEVFAIEADKVFYKEYEAKRKKVTLLPYAAWIRNESLFFEVNHDPGDDVGEKGASGRGMGRIKPVQTAGGGKERKVDEIEGFDFAEWLKREVSEKDYVVMKMDVEGTEFDLIPRLIETGAICLIDEVFLECHYNRWQRCCPGVRSAKYEKTYGQCLNLFNSLRARGVLVHQWW